MRPGDEKKTLDKAPVRFTILWSPRRQVYVIEPFRSAELAEQNTFHPPLHAPATRPLLLHPPPLFIIRVTYSRSHRAHRAINNSSSMHTQPHANPTLSTCVHVLHVYICVPSPPSQAKPSGALCVCQVVHTSRFALCCFTHVHIMTSMKHIPYIIFLRTKNEREHTTRFKLHTHIYIRHSDACMAL